MRSIRIKNILHKGLRRLVEDNDTSGIPAESVGKLQRIVAFLQDMESEDQLRQISSWKPHMLTGNRKETWSLSVTRNWRLTFRIDNAAIEIIDLEYEDYH